ncbi:MAG TPA: BRO family protein, partial [Phenylobacterium sp.]|uniref:BRO family protein n=1 Tax=Phenylobacterium sp. TaxID=1871053 RepID=UPI002D49D6E6
MDDLVPSEPHRHTMERLEAAKRLTEKGVEYWLARDLGPILGYQIWQNFEGVIQRAVDALTANGKEPSHQIMPTHKLMGTGQKAKDFFLSRAASYLIAMNGDPSKPEVAAAQIYFAVKARQMEVSAQTTADRKRLEAREKVSVAHKLVSGVAHDAGVQNNMQAVFHGARFT